MAQSNKERALAFLKGVDARDVDSVVRFVSPSRYLQHIPFVDIGVAELKSWITALPPAKNPMVTVRCFEDGPFVFPQSRGDMPETHISFDVVRFEEGLIVERWVFWEPAAPPNASGHTQIDGPTEARHLDDTQKNKALVQEYYQTVHISGDHAAIPRYVSEDHIRHEPGVHNGLSAFLEDLKKFNQPGKPTRTVDDITFILGEGDLVLVSAMGTLASKPCAYIDLYRAEGSTLVEHWGFMQTAGVGSDKA
jgi:predicted SnoaL-like aldol condensation-catalyzing enzyme